MKRATTLVWTVATVFLVCSCSMARSGNEDVGDKDVGNATVANTGVENTAVANNNLGNGHIVIARQKMNLATEAFWKTATAARYIITYLEIQSGSPEILKWMGELAVVYPQTFRLGFDANEVVKPLTESERVKYGYPELVRQERRANEKMNKLRSMLHAYGYPSTEFGILWDRMEKKALEEKTALDDKEQFKKTVVITDGPRDAVATFSTGAFLAKKGQVLIISHDNFLQGFIHKKTGKRSYYVHNIIRYRGSDWSFYSVVHYEAPDGPKAKQVMVIDRDAHCSDARNVGCILVEHVGFHVDEELLRFVAEKYEPGARLVWNYKLLPQNGEDYKDGILHAEVAGFLERMDDYAWRSLTMLQRGAWTGPEGKPSKEEATEDDVKYLCEQYQMCPHKPRVHPGGWLW
ncbi:MAG: hypothetical protein ACE5K9_08280 [Candidatus Methylomirabilales bacterium]